jgi:hypothetical protein
LPDERVSTAAERIVDRTRANLGAEMEELQRRRNILKSIAHLACEAQEDIDRILEIFQVNNVNM